MLNEASTASESLHVCPVDGCGRRLVINWERPALTVLDRGDFFAQHTGFSGGLTMHVAVSPG